MPLVRNLLTTVAALSRHTLVLKKFLTKKTGTNHELCIFYGSLGRSYHIHGRNGQQLILTGALVHQNHKKVLIGNKNISYGLQKVRLTQAQVYSLRPNTNSNTNIKVVYRRVDLAQARQESLFYAFSGANFGLVYGLVMLELKSTRLEGPVVCGHSPVRSISPEPIRLFLSLRSKDNMFAQLTLGLPFTIVYKQLNIFKTTRSISTRPNLGPNYRC